MDMMQTRILCGAEVRRLLTMEDTIGAMREALRGVSSGSAAMLQRQMLPQPEENKFAVMGGADSALGLCGAKVIVFPGPAAAPDTASREMCTFLIINISSLQLIPINMIAYRSQYGSANPAAITGPALLATAVSTAAAVVFCRLMEFRRE